MKLYTKPFIGFFLALLLFSSCTSSKNETNLTTTDLAYFESIGLLDSDEKVILFDAQSDFETSGNLVTNKRVASYWIDGKNDVVNSAYYEDIDKFETIYREEDPFNSSILVVHHDQKFEFNVYVDRDKIATEYFFNTAIETWQQHQ